MQRRLILAFALSALAAGPALAQRGARPPQDNSAGYKDPQLSTVLGLMVPGGGQIYAGRPVKGGILLTVAVASPLIGILGAMAMDNGCCDGRGRSMATFTADGSVNEPFRRSERRHNEWAPIAAGFGVSLVSWAYGWMTAASDARAHNAAYGFSRLGALVTPLQQGQTGIGFTVGLP